MEMIRTLQDFQIFAFNASATNLAQTQAASDANLTINGLAVTSSSNTVTTAVEELSFTLKETFSETETITVSHDASQITSTVQGFVDGYNELIDAINQQTSYDADAQISSTLTGDSTLRALVNQIRSSLNASVFNPNADYEYLASVGIKTDAITGKFESTQRCSTKRLLPIQMMLLLFLQISQNPVPPMSNLVRRHQQLKRGNGHDDLCANGHDDWNTQGSCA